MANNTELKNLEKSLNQERRADEWLAAIKCNEARISNLKLENAYRIYAIERDELFKTWYHFATMTDFLKSVDIKGGSATEYRKVGRFLKNEFRKDTGDHIVLRSFFNGFSFRALYELCKLESADEFKNQESGDFIKFVERFCREHGVTCEMGVRSVKTQVDAYLHPERYIDDTDTDDTESTDTDDTESTESTDTESAVENPVDAVQAMFAELEKYVSIDGMSLYTRIKNILYPIEA